MYKIVLAGNPNSGKTTLFNKLTGSNQHIGNWPGVTIEKKEGFFCTRGLDIIVTDLPGIYSMSPYSPEEKITREYILNEKPDLIINIIDASNLERNLYLSTHLTELGFDILFVLNMMDVVEKSGLYIDIDMLENEFGYQFVSISASKNVGIDTLLIKIEENLKGKKIHKIEHKYFRNEIIDACKSISQKLVYGEQNRFIAIKVLENDPEILKEFEISRDLIDHAQKVREEIEGKYNDDIESLIIVDRYDFVSRIIKKSVVEKRAKKKTFSDKIDSVLMNKVLAFPIFLLSMFLIFSVTFGKVTTSFVDLLTRLIDNSVKPLIIDILNGLNASDFTIDLIINGVIDGVGAVIVFTPQLIVLFFFISFLEDSGYMARAALLTDKILRQMGLTGKSFIPFVIGFGCSVPAIMAARTLDSEKDRKLTIFLAPFMSCGARAPIYAMLASVFFFRSKSLIIFSVYLLGIVVSMLAGLLLSKTIFKGDESPFVLELPKYQIPQFRDLVRHTAGRSKEFVKKAGTIILAASIVVWFLTNLDTSFRIAQGYDKSIISEIGRVMSTIFIPLGFGDWVPTVAIITGIFAKESIVSTINIISGAEGIRAILTPLSAYSFLVFILFYVPCIASIGAMKRELNSLKWTMGAVAFQTATAWIMAFLVYNAGRLVGLA